MPPLAAAVAAYLSVSTAMAYMVIVSAVLTLASVAYSAYMMATMEAPAQPDASKRLQTVRSSVQPHRVIYGECMTSGVLVYAQTHSIDPSTGELDNEGENKYISLVVAFTGHEVEEIKEVWFNDKISSDSVFIKHVNAVPAEGYFVGGSDSDPIGTFVETKAAIPEHDEVYATVFKYTGTATQEANDFLISLPAKPSNIVSKNPTSGLNDLVINNFDGSPLGPYNQQGMCSITLTVTDTDPSGDTVSWVQDIYTSEGLVANNASGTFVMPGPDTAISLANGIVLWFGSYDGSGNGIRNNTGHSIGQIWEIRAFDGAPWTSECRLQGRSYVVATLEYSDKAFPTGLPNIKALIKGNNQIYDPRTDTTGYSDNWALCVRDYLTKPYGLNAPVSDINETTAIAAANICDESIELANSGSQNRYTINGSFTLDKTPTSIMNEILATAYGAITWTQGQYRILPAAFYAPDLTFHGMNASVPGLTESDLRGQLKVRPAPSLKDKFNAVKGTYVSPETWQMVDFPKVGNEFYQDQDGYEIVKDVQLTYVTNSVRAQRIAKIMLEKSRQGIMVDFPAKWSAFPLAVGDVVPITIAKLGWDQKLFTIRDWKMHSEGGVDLSLQEEAEECYDWNFGEETTTDLAQDTLLPDPRYVSLVTGLVVGEELYATNVGSIVKSRVILTWNNMGLRQYEANYKPSNNTIWTPLPLTLDTTCVVDDTIPGTYNFRVRGMNFLGVWGDWSTISYLVKGKLAPPPNVDSFLITPQQDGTRTLSWLMHNAPLDLAGWRIKFRRGTDAGLWSTMTALHSGLLISSPFESNQLSAGDYVFGIVAVDTTGNESLNPLYIQTTLPDPRMTNVWTSSLNMDGDWPGIKINCYVNSEGALEANDISSWNTIPATWAEWTRWNWNSFTSFVYETSSIDLGHSLYFTPQVTAFGVGNITIEMITSLDNSSWNSWSVLEKTQARYVKFKASVISNDAELFINLFANSREFNNATWAKARSSITTNAATAPDGTVTAEKLIADTQVELAHHVNQSVSVTAGTSYILDVCAKAGEYQYLALQFLNTNGAYAGSLAYFDLLAGTFTNSSCDAAGIENLGDGWYRCWASETAIATVSGLHLIMVCKDYADVSFTGDGTSGIFIWNGQLQVKPSSVSTTNLINLSELSAYLIVKPVIEEVNDLPTSSLTGSYRIGTGDVRIPLTGDYDILNQVSVTLQNVGPGWSWQLIDKDTTLGPRIKIFDGLAAADCNIDAYIKGV